MEFAKIGDAKKLVNRLMPMPTVCESGGEKLDPHGRIISYRQRSRISGDTVNCIVQLVTLSVTLLFGNVCPKYGHHDAAYPPKCRNAECAKPAP